jgi:poly(A) polymerase
MAHRRMIAPSPKRGGKSSLVQRQYFHDALLFLGFSVEARDNDGGVLDPWQQLATGLLATGSPGSGSGSGRGTGSDDGGGGQAKRKRSRGRRGKRKPRREGDGPSRASASES